jgi:mRNA-degrading endonuclease RelE of RelBE toxin-antitoxin system
MEKYQIQLIPLAIKLLGKIKDKREQKLLTKKIEQLKQEPEKQGKPLSGKLKNYPSVRAVGQRYRISNIDSNVPHPIFSSCFISSIFFFVHKSFLHNELYNAFSVS